MNASSAARPPPAPPGCTASGTCNTQTPAPPVACRSTGLGSPARPSRPQTKRPPESARSVADQISRSPMPAAMPLKIALRCPESSARWRQSRSAAATRFPQLCETISSLLFLHRRGHGRQTFFDNQFHRVFHGNLCDPGVLVHPAQILVRLGVSFHFFPHVVLRVRQMSRHPLYSRLRRKVCALLAHRRGRFVRIGPVMDHPLVNAYGQNERSNDRNSEIRQKVEDRRRPDIRRFKRNVRVLRPFAVRLPVVVMLIAHSAQAPPKDLGRPPAAKAAASGSSRKIPATNRSAQPAPRYPATSATPAT